MKTWDSVYISPNVQKKLRKNTKKKYCFGYQIKSTKIKEIKKQNFRGKKKERKNSSLERTKERKKEREREREREIGFCC